MLNKLLQKTIYIFLFGIATLTSSYAVATCVENNTPITATVKTKSAPNSLTANLLKLETAIKAGDFATVQALVPAKINPKTAKINNKLLRLFAADCRKQYNTNEHDQIAYYLGCAAKQNTTPLIVFFKQHKYKILIGCGIGAALIIHKKMQPKRKRNPNKKPNQNQNVNDDLISVPDDTSVNNNDLITKPDAPAAPNDIEKLNDGTLVIPENINCAFCHEPFNNHQQAAHFDCQKENQFNYWGYNPQPTRAKKILINTHLYHVDCIEKWKKHTAYCLDGVNQCIVGCAACSDQVLYVPIKCKPVEKKADNTKLPAACLLCNKNFKKNDALCCAKLHPDCDKNHSVHQNCMDKWRQTAFNNANIYGGDDVLTTRGACWPARGACCPHGCIDPDKQGNYFYLPEAIKKQEKPYEAFIATQDAEQGPEIKKLEIPEELRAKAKPFDNTIEANNKRCCICTDESNDKDDTEGLKCRWLDVTCKKGHTITYCEPCWDRRQATESGEFNPCSCIQTVRNNNKQVTCGSAYTQELLDAGIWHTNAE